LRCAATWIRKPGGLLTADWHVNSDDSLCYVLDREWADQVSAIEEESNTEAAIAAAAFITINNARWLLYRHFQGYRRKLKKWPAEWPQWEHGSWAHRLPSTAAKEMMEAPNSMEAERFRINLEHARAAYANAQETIRSVDTKTGVLTGVLTVTTGLPFAFLQFIVSSESQRAARFIDWYSSCGPAAQALATLPLILGICFGAFSLMSSTNGLMARHPHKAGERERAIPIELTLFLLRKLSAPFRRHRAPTGSTAKLTSLFPLFPQHRTAEAVRDFQRLGAGEYRAEDVLAEYAAQLASVGTILNTKIERNRDAVRWFELQIVTYVLGASAALSLLWICHPRPSVSPAASIQHVLTEPAPPAGSPAP
jgi:hypothetical protein